MPAYLSVIGFFRTSALNRREFEFNDNPENPLKVLHANNESEGKGFHWVPALKKSSKYPTLNYIIDINMRAFLCRDFMDLLWLHKKVIWFSRNYNLENLAVCRNYSWFNCVTRCRDRRFPQFHHIILCSGLIRQTWMIFLSIFLLLSRNGAFIFKWLEWSPPHTL